MQLAVISHKLVWKSDDSPSHFSTDGGFPFQMKAISELFETTTLVVPCDTERCVKGTTFLEGKDLKVEPLSVPRGRGFSRKLTIPMWILKNGRIIWRQIRQADAVHTPIPGDVGTIGMLFALLQRKPLFVRHCGNWFVQKTLAERLWRWSMEYFGGGRNVMLVTGGSADSPSRRNKNVEWIFSTSLRRNQILNNEPRTLPENEKIRLIIACRQEQKKGTDIVVQSLPYVLKHIPNASLDIVGDGSQLPKLKAMVEDLGLHESVKFHGKLEHSEVLSMLKKSHIFCFPTSASEGFPKAVLEALATGLPVITTNVSVLPELTKSGGGVLIDGNEPSELANAVIEICSHQERYQAMSVEAIKTAQQYSLEAWKELIDEVLCKSWGVTSLS